MTSTLRNHLCAGKRIYADGGGWLICASPLRRWMGELPMVGALPAVARLNRNPAPCQPVEFAGAPVGSAKSARACGAIVFKMAVGPAGALTHFCERARI